MSSLLTIVRILNFKKIFCNNFILNFRSNDELSPLTTDQTGGYEHQSLPDENPRDDIGDAEEKRIRLVISNCFVFLKGYGGLQSRDLYQATLC